MFQYFDYFKTNYQKNARFSHKQHFNKQHQAETGKKLSKQHAVVELLTKMSKKQVYLFQLDFMVNCKENENDNKKDYINTTTIDLDVDIDTNVHMSPGKMMGMCNKQTNT